nr:PAS domain S-box protein [bacterium]
MRNVTMRQCIVGGVLGMIPSGASAAGPFREADVLGYCAVILIAVLMILIGVLVGISRRSARAEREARRSEQRYRSIVHSTMAGIHMYELTPDGALRFTGANPAADWILGVDNAQFIGKTIEEAFPQLQNTEVPEQYRHVAATGNPWSTEQVVYDEAGITGVFEVRAFQTEPGRMAAMFTDISARKRTEQALKQSEEKYRALFESANEGIMVLQDGMIVFANPRVAQVARCSMDELMTRPFIEFIHPEDRERTMERYRIRLSSGAGDLPRTFTTRIVGCDGTVRWIELVGTVIEWDGMPAVLSLFSDVTDRIDAEQELQHLRKLLSNILNSMPSVLIGVDSDGVITHWNNRAEQVFGVTTDTAIGR